MSGFREDCTHAWHGLRPSNRPRSTPWSSPFYLRAWESGTPLTPLGSFVVAKSLSCVSTRCGCWRALAHLQREPQRREQSRLQDPLLQALYDPLTVSNSLVIGEKAA